MEKLQHKMSLGAVVAISASAMLGSGIFVLPGLAAAKTGPSVFLAYVLAGICVLPAAMSKAELATAVPTSGGTYVYLDRTFGPLAGTVAGIGLWLSLLLKSAFALVGFGAYLSVLADIPLIPMALVFLVLITILNVYGVKRVGVFQQVIVLTSVISFSLLAIWGLFVMDGANLVPAFPMGTTGFFSATAFVFVAFAGVTNVAAVAEEVEDPARNLPRGILISLGVVTAMYGLIVLAIVGTVPWAELSGDIHPVYTFSNALAGPYIGWIAALLGVLTMTSMANSGLLAASRFPFAMSRDALLPQWLTALHPEYLTPVRSIILTSVAIALSIVMLDVEKMAKLASAFILLIYLAENLAVIVLREATTVWYRPPFRAPFYPWLQIIGIVSGLALLLAMGPFALVASLITVIPGVVLYLFYSRHRIQRRGVLGKLGQRRELITSRTNRAADPIAEVAAEAEVTPSATLKSSRSPSVIVGLLGRTRSPEVLVEVGAGLSDGRSMDVLHLTEIPEQTLLDAMEHESVMTTSVRRRVTAMAESRQLDLEFIPAVTHDLVETVNDYCEDTKGEWLVLEWQGWSSHRFGLHNPLGWLIHHLPCNLAAYRDKGIRNVRRIMVLAEPGPHDALVVHSADHLAGLNDAELEFVNFVPDSASAAQVQTRVDYLDQLLHLCEAPARIQILRGRDELLALSQATAAYDLVITGAPPVGSWLQNLTGTRLDRLTHRAACSVLRLTTPRSRTHESLERTKTSEATAAPFQLLDYLEHSVVGARQEINRKDLLFQHFAQSLAKAVPGVDAARIAQELWAREKLQNTSIGQGIALPHAALDGAVHPCFGVFTTAEPIGYDAPDDKPVDVFIVTVGPPRDRHLHLKLLSGISRLIVSSPLLDRLRNAETADECIRALEECLEIARSAE